MTMTSATERRLGHPSSSTAPKNIISVNGDVKNLDDQYWTEKCRLNAEFKILLEDSSGPVRPLSSFSPDVASELHQMIADWHKEAKQRVASMPEDEYKSLLASFGVPTRAVNDLLYGYTEQDLVSETDPFDDAFLARHCTDHGQTHVGQMSPHSSTSLTSAASNSSVSGSSAKAGTWSGASKRKSSAMFGGPKYHFMGGSRPSSSKKLHWKFSSKQSTDNRRRRQREHHDAKSSGSRPKESSDYYEAEEDRTEDYDNDDLVGEYDDEDEDDQLTQIVQRQKQMFSARAAAGRPSARKLNSDGFGPKMNQLRPLTIPASAGRSSVLGKVLRAWKSLAKKIVCKVARQRASCRRDKLVIAKRAARECSRLLRQRALVSQKSAKDAISRGHRLAREIATQWRNSAASLANNSGPLIINGVSMPTSAASSTLSSMLQLPDYFSGTSGDNVSSDVLMVDCSAAARRRAEKAAAEQRRADMELLEARRQQRKLNFLITQTELYAHFMARKMADPTTTTTDAPVIDPSAETGIAETSLLESEAETHRILKRLEEPDADSPDNKDSNQTDVEVNEDSTPDTGTNMVPNETNAKPTSSSSIAVAAKLAASRLGINMEDEYDIEHVKSEALLKVKAAVEKERSRALQFLASHPPKAQQPIKTDEQTDLANSTATPTAQQVQAPQLFRGQLKAYQLRGLNWLLGLFDQGINGILADEMGLGKTIQTIAFLGCLAQNYNIWGPFLIVTPASTLHNWTQEFARFLPAFRLVPYWGTPSERKVLRRFWSSIRPHQHHTNSLDDSSLVGQTGTKDAELHVVITSYQVVLQDSKFINKTSWAYIVLDEAHAIKSTSSLRWRILLSFKCRNRLLLTGTPIQNTMQELWALLHFIMPTLFDSHDEFANWFSRDIESQASATAGGPGSSTSGGGGGPIGAGSLVTSKLNENQLSRLHLILKPFMLRRTKQEVEHEISTKTEIMRYCPLSHRQHVLYERLRNKIRLEDLSSIMASDGSTDVFQTASNPTLNAGASATAHLINLVMQLRKVCNHPDLWERRDVRFACSLGRIVPSTLSWGHQTNRTQMADQTTHLAYWLMPKLLYNEGLLSDLSWKSVGLQTGPFGTNLPAWPLEIFGLGLDSDRLALVARLFSLFHPAHIHEDLWHQDPRDDDHTGIPEAGGDQSIRELFEFKCFAFARLMNLSPYELALVALSHPIFFGPLSQWTSSLELLVLQDLFKSDPSEDYPFESNLPWQSNKPPNIFMKPLFPLSVQKTNSTSFAMLDHSKEFLLLPNPRQPVYSNTGEYISSVMAFSTSDSQSFLPNCLHLTPTSKVFVSPLQIHVNVPYFSSRSTNCLHPRASATTMVQSTHIPLPRTLELVPLTTRISDSGKLTALDQLLAELKPAGHRVLIYSQMTRMIDILEEFMLYRKHAYLRLDGSSRLSDRRDMVAQWQTNPRWFVFLLSTRAGGLGINLTAADTVIFYDSDWNPTVDQQAMDRAHRLGQTKPVTVYRLICKNTVEGRMLRRAEEKRAMQQMVIQSSQDGVGSLISDIGRSGGSSDHLTSSEMVSLLLDDDELVKRLQIRRRLQPQRGRPSKIQSASRLMSTQVKSVPVPKSTQPSAPGCQTDDGATMDPGVSTVGSGSNGGTKSWKLDPVDQGAIDSLDRKRQAAWAEQTRSGRPKKIRPLESIAPGLSTLAESDNDTESTN